MLVCYRSVQTLKLYYTFIPSIPILKIIGFLLSSTAIYLHSIPIDYIADPITQHILS